MHTGQMIARLGALGPTVRRMDRPDDHVLATRRHEAAAGRITWLLRRDVGSLEAVRSGYLNGYLYGYLEVAALATISSQSRR